MGLSLSLKEDVAGSLSEQELAELNGNVQLFVC